MKPSRSTLAALHLGSGFGCCPSLWGETAQDRHWLGSFGLRGEKHCLEAFESAGPVSMQSFLLLHPLSCGGQVSVLPCPAHCFEWGCSSCEPKVQGCTPDQRTRSKKPGRQSLPVKLNSSPQGTAHSDPHVQICLRIALPAEHCDLQPGTGVSSTSSKTFEGSCAHQPSAGLRSTRSDPKAHTAPTPLKIPS